MNEHQDYGESVLFVFKKGNLYLTEYRDWGGSMINSIPGGKIDPDDHDAEDLKTAALSRELNEEFGITEFKYDFIGEIWLKQEWLFHVYHILEWTGAIPEKVLDSDNALNWVAYADIGKCFMMPGLRTLIKEKLEDC